MSIHKPIKNSNIANPLPSAQKSVTDLSYSTTEKAKKQLSSSMNVTTKVESSQDSQKSRKKFPSELRPFEQLTTLYGVRLTKDQKEQFGFFRELSMNIYEALSMIMVENLFKQSEIDYIVGLIDCMKTPEYHVLTNIKLADRNKKISKDVYQKYLKAQNSLVVLFESYLDLRLNNDGLRDEIVYDFYNQVNTNEELKLSCNAFLRGFVAGFSVNNKRSIVDNYKIFNLEENSALTSDFDLITYSTDLEINYFESDKGSDLKFLRTYKYGVEGKPNGSVRLMKHGIIYYLLYGKEQKPLLEKEIIKNGILNRVKKPSAEDLKEKGLDKIPKTKVEKPEDSQMQTDSVLPRKVSPVNENPKLETPTFSGTCSKCFNKTHSKPLFTVSPCKHTICFECMIKYGSKNSQNYRESTLCPLSTCISRFYEEDVQEYFNQIQINESLTMSQITTNNSKENSIAKGEDKDSSHIDLNLEPKIKCCSCHKSTPQSKIFTNSECHHCFCYDCASIKLNRYKFQNFCEDRYCHKYINQKALEKYLREYVTKDTKDANTLEVSQECFSCHKKFKLTITLGADFDFFQCASCQITSCLTHCAPLNNCFCYCETCYIKTEADWIKPSCRYCPNCKRKFCLLCKDSLSKCECYCRACESVLISEKGRLYCGPCKDSCSVCGVKTNEKNRVIASKCGHTYCRPCAYVKWTEKGREYCLKRSY